MSEVITQATIEYRGNKSFLLGTATRNQNEVIALEVYGPEATVMALAHHLVKYELRGKPFETDVVIRHQAGGELSVTHIALAPGKFRFRGKLITNGKARWSQTIMFLDALRPSSSDDFFFLKDEDQPAWFFKRLSNVCPIPLRPEWAGWLWARGNQHVRVKYVNPGGISTDKKAQPPFLAEETVTPISKLGGEGLDVYRIRTKGVLDEYKLAWLEIIWAELGLSEKMYAVSTGYANSTLQIAQVEKELVLTEKKTGKQLAKGDSLEWLVVRSRMAGVPLELV